MSLLGFGTPELRLTFPVSGHLAPAWSKKVDPEGVLSDLDGLDHLPPLHIDDGNRIALPVYGELLIKRRLVSGKGCTPQKLDPLEIQRFFEIAICKFPGMTTKQIPC